MEDRILLTWTWHDGEVGAKIVNQKELDRWKAEHSMALGEYLKYGTRAL